jgi:hypothetical protein
MHASMQGQSLILAGQSLRKFQIQHKNNKPVFVNPLEGQLYTANQEENTTVVSMSWDTYDSMGIVGSVDGSVTNILSFISHCSHLFAIDPSLIRH